MTTYQKLMAEAKAEFDAWEQEQAEIKNQKLLAKLLDTMHHDK